MIILQCQDIAVLQSAKSSNVNWNSETMVLHPASMEVEDASKQGSSQKKSNK